MMERRLAAILAADMVGNSRLMAEDEAGTLARLKALRKDPIDPEIAGQGGRIVKLMGDGMLDGEDVYGDGVNVAARLEGIAEPGGICLSGDVYRQVKAKTELHFQDLGEKALKNIPDKVRIYSVNLDPARLSPETFEALTGERLELPE